MFLAGVPVRTDLVRELACTVDDDELATELQTAVVHDVKIIALDFAERDRILEALADDCPDVALWPFSLGSSSFQRSVRR